MYFASLTGAFKGIRAELHRADREVQRNRSAESQAKKKRQFITLEFNKKMTPSVLADWGLFSWALSIQL